MGARSASKGWPLSPLFCLSPLRPSFGGVIPALLLQVVRPESCDECPRYRASSRGRFGERPATALPAHRSRPWRDRSSGRRIPQHSHRPRSCRGTPQVPTGAPGLAAGGRPSRHAPGGIQTIRFVGCQPGAQFLIQPVRRGNHAQVAAEFAHNGGGQLLLPRLEIGCPSQKCVEIKSHGSPRFSSMCGSIGRTRRTDYFTATARAVFAKSGARSPQREQGKKRHPDCSSDPPKTLRELTGRDPISVAVGEANGELFLGLRQRRSSFDDDGIPILAHDLIRLRLDARRQNRSSAPSPCK